MDESGISDEKPHVTSDTSDVEKTIGQVIELDDENTVWWDGENDSANPLNWPRWKKTVNLGVIFTLTFVFQLALSTFTPTVPLVMTGFNETSKPLTGFVASDSTLGNIFGPLIMAPLSEIYGRVPVFHTCNVLFVIVLAGCAFAPSLPVLIVLRFLGGIFSCCPAVIGGGSVFDMVLPEYRGPVIVVAGLSQVLSSMVGPVSGGFIAGSLGWRWMFKFLAVVDAVVVVVMFVVASESYAPVLLQRKTLRLRRETGNPLLRSRLDMGLSRLEYLKRSFVRPFKILVRSPYALALTLYAGITFGFFAIVMTSIAPMFEQIYNISTSFIGLTTLGIMSGALIGAVSNSIVGLRMKDQVIKDGGQIRAESRLKMLPISATLFAIGYLVFGWTTQYSVHIIVPILSHIPIGAGLSLVLVSVAQALTDAFTVYAASANAVVIVMTDIFGATMPLFSLQMYATMGMGWGNTLIAFIWMLMIPASLLIMRYGEYLRTAFPVRNI